MVIALITLTLLLTFANWQRSNTDHVVEVRRRFIQGNAKSAESQDLPSQYGSIEAVIENDPYLRMRINDLKQIKLSLNNELIEIERAKSKLLREEKGLSVRNEKLLAQINRSKSLLRQLELDIVSNKKRLRGKSCDTDQASIIVFNPLKSEELSSYLMHDDDMKISGSSHDLDRLSLKYHKCPLTREFRFSIVIPREFNLSMNAFSMDSQISSIHDLLIAHRSFTNDPSQACLTISFLTESSETFLSDQLSRDSNNLVIDLFGSGSRGKILNLAMIASPVFIRNSFRDRLDIVIPNMQNPSIKYEAIMGSMPLQSPIDRKYLASYFGRDHHIIVENDMVTSKSYKELVQKFLVQQEEILKTIHRSSIDDMFLFMYNCGPSNKQCYEDRAKMIEHSTFLIILPTEADTDFHINDLIYLGLSRGSIPVIFGKESVRLPFDEVLDWSKASILIPTARLPEIHFILKSYNPYDIYELKYYGRRIFEKYIADLRRVIDTILGVIRLERFNHSPLPVENTATIKYFIKNAIHDSSNLSKGATEIWAGNESILNAQSLTLLTPELLGPHEAPLASPKYRRNFSLSFNNGYETWNHPMHSPFQLYPSLPDDPLAPSEYKYLSLDQSYRPIANGLGGSGAEFSRDLGGDVPNEQFTVILLTHNRVQLLIKTLERFKGMPYVNKYIVVWNSVREPPSSDLIVPDMGASIVFIKAQKNSLNNRFIPFEDIETDAILSIDDDTPLRQDEIIFAFRVWRESRDRIVGFPGRYHAWDGAQNSWVYNSNHSCELSMVLTGGAFFHRYYSYMYTYNMPSIIRSLVDQFMNCEDIAMNFLVAHLTRKPPIKVTSRWTFHCTSCQSSLSDDETHFRERHECLNIFASVYGYMPLLSTQYRADSVLFKTRLPRDKQKCFRFV